MKSLFKVPQKVHHGLFIVTSLAEHQDSGKPLNLAELARSRNLSRGFLEEVAASLRSAGLIQGRRGKAGGYTLTRSAEDITVADIVEAIEGPIALTDCMSDEVDCQLLKHFASQNIWYAIQRSITEKLSTTTVADVVKTSPKHIYG